MAAYVVLTVFLVQKGSSESKRRRLESEDFDRDPREADLRKNVPWLFAVEYVRTSQFWHESFQNWQSEFLAVGSIVLFSVWLRQRGSPESKPVGALYSETG